MMLLALAAMAGASIGNAHIYQGNQVPRKDFETCMLGREPPESTIVPE